MRKRLTESISVEEMKQMYENGMSYRDIANSLDCSYQTVWTYLKDIVSPRSKGGRCARRFPKPEHAAKPKTMDELATQNAANACLVVQEHTIRLAGIVGEYVVNAGRKSAKCILGGVEVELQFESIPGLIEELKALMRNVDSLNVGCEMW